MSVRALPFVLALLIAATAQGEIPPGLAPGGEPVSIYLVRFAEPSLARWNVGRGAPRRDRRLDAAAPASRAYLGELDRLHSRRLDAFERRLGRGLTAVFRYRAALNGLALRLTGAEAERLAALPGVASVSPDRLHPLDTDAGPWWTGADTVWDGSATSPLPGTLGDGVIVGVVDSGINMDHRSFSDAVAPPYTNPLGSGNFLGWCDPGHPSYDPAYVCNDKLIGAWDFADAVTAEADGPVDDYFHGSHVASIAVGNALVWPPVSGVAPRASLIAYDACDATSCPASAIVAAVDQALLDGVDVLNLSIGAGLSPWSDAVELALLDAVDAGVFVAASAGNTGPTPGTVGHHGPWATTVAASFHHRIGNENLLQDLSGGDTLPPADMTGVSLTAGYGPAPIVYEGDCSAPFAPATFSGEIVVCDFLALFGRWGYCANLAAGGAGGCVVANNSAGLDVLDADYHVLPATHVDLAAGDTLRAWLAGGAGHVATLSDSAQVYDLANADRVADGSSRGPAASLDVLKPDLTAPGWRILGATAVIPPGITDDEFLRVSGTSMSSPHVAGAAALLLSLRPALSPAEVRSALMTTAETSLLEEDGLTAADPWARGAGRVDLGRAARVGLVLDENAASYAAADPDLGGDPRTLNLPYLVDGDCAGRCSFSRTVASIAGASVQWTVVFEGPPGVEVETSPASFTLPVPATVQELDVEVKLLGPLPLDEWVFGELVLTPDDMAIPEARLPVAVWASNVFLFADGFESGDVLAWSSVVP